MHLTNPFIQYDHSLRAAKENREILVARKMELAILLRSLGIISDDLVGSQLLPVPGHLGSFDESTLI